MVKFEKRTHKNLLLDRDIFSYLPDTFIFINNLGFISSSMSGLLNVATAANAAIKKPGNPDMISFTFDIIAFSPIKISMLEKRENDVVIVDKTRGIHRIYNILSACLIL